MLTRFKVSGFKNLVDVDVRFGPFTCIAGPNGVGKSNLFDAIRFLGALADKSLLEAALSVRSEGGAGGDPRAIFFRVGELTTPTMSFETEMIVPREGVDDLGQPAKAAITFLRYGLDLELQKGEIKIRRESLDYISQSTAKGELKFPHTAAWRRSAIAGKRSAPFISTEGGQVRLHTDMGEGYKGGGRPRPYVADRLPRTVLSDANAADSATTVLARREMQSWRILQLEPSALRTSDPYSALRSIASNGAHVPATLARLAGIVPGGGPRTTKDPDAVFAQVANRLSQLIDGVRSVRIEADDRRELLTLILTDETGTEHEARALSDGTLRFIALGVLETDPEATGVLCFEEPENGIHPERIPAMRDLLEDIAVDPELPIGEDNPLRQVIVNSHSPAVIEEVTPDDLLMATTRYVHGDQGPSRRPDFRAVEGTWRSKAGETAVPLATIHALLDPMRRRRNVEPKKPRVLDFRDPEQLLLLS